MFLRVIFKPMDYKLPRLKEELHRVFYLIVLCLQHFFFSFSPKIYILPGLFIQFLQLRHMSATIFVRHQVVTTSSPSYIFIIVTKYFIVKIS
jgi:hypothetical protein